MTEEVLKEIEALAKLPGITAEDIGIIMGIDGFEKEIQDPESTYYAPYKRGRLISKSEHAKKVKLLSDQGSGPAQTLQDKLVRRQQYIDILNSYNERE